MADFWLLRAAGRGLKDDKLLLLPRQNELAAARIDEPEAIPREISSRSVRVSARSARRRTAGTIPP